MTLILGAHDIAALVDGIDVIAAVEAIHADLGTGRMHQPAPPTLAGGDDSLFLPMSARSDRLGLVVVKTLADVPANAARGLPTQRSTLVATSASPESASPSSTAPPSPGTGQRPRPRSPPATWRGRTAGYSG